MTSQLHGRFYLKLTTNGNLIGEFSNNKKNKIYTESCCTVKEKQFEKSYIGTYYSTWREASETCQAILKIKYKPNTNNKIFLLIWINNNKICYSGEGMLCDNILIGNYINI